MKYAILIYGEEAEGITPSRLPAEFAPLVANFEEQVRQAGVLVTSQPLMPTDTAQTLRNIQGNVVAIDGPFSETKEQLGGFYLLDCADMDEAMKFARLIPCAPHGSIEVRPVFEPPAGV